MPDLDPPAAGHNSGEQPIVFPSAARRGRTARPVATTPDGQATDNRLRLLIERVERLEEEKAGIAEDIRDVFGEMKAVGYDVKIARQVLRLRKMDPGTRAEMEMLLDTYKCALGLR